MKLHLLLLAPLLVLTLPSCKKDKQPSAPAQPAKAMRNVAYGSQPLQQMDILFPAGYNANTPVVFLIHGGGFIAGVKEDFENQAQLFRNQNFVVVNLSHRLVDTSGLFTLPPTHQASAIKVADELADVDAAVQKFKSEAAAWGLGTGRMYMAGHSAGAILSMLYVQGDYNTDGHIRASGNWAGYTDLSLPSDTLLAHIDPRWQELFYRSTGYTYQTSNNLAFMAISPYWQANNHNGFPNISVFPEHNGIFGIPNEDSFQLARTQSFHALLQNKGVAERLVVYQGEDHGFGTRPDSWGKLVGETAAFFRQH